MANPSRQPAGAPHSTGGQFAPDTRPEPAMTLDTGPFPKPTAYATVPADYRFVTSDLPQWPHQLSLPDLSVEYGDYGLEAHLFTDGEHLHIFRDDAYDLQLHWDNESFDDGTERPVLAGETQEHVEEFGEAFYERAKELTEDIEYRAFDSVRQDIVDRASERQADAGKTGPVRTGPILVDTISCLQDEAYALPAWPANVPEATVSVEPLYGDRLPSLSIRVGQDELVATTPYEDDEIETSWSGVTLDDKPAWLTDEQDEQICQWARVAYVRARIVHSHASQQLMDQIGGQLADVASGKTS